MSPLLLTLAEISLSHVRRDPASAPPGPSAGARYQPRWRYWAWLAVSVRLLIPWNPDLPHAPVQWRFPRRIRWCWPVPPLPPQRWMPPVRLRPAHRPMPDASPPPASAPAGSAAEAIPAPQPAEQQTAWTLRLDTVLTALWAGGLYCPAGMARPWPAPLPALPAAVVPAFVVTLRPGHGRGLDRIAWTDAPA